jgi:hypothetical protein
MGVAFKMPTDASRRYLTRGVGCMSSTVAFVVLLSEKSTQARLITVMTAEMANHDSVNIVDIFWEQRYGQPLSFDFVHHRFRAVICLERPGTLPSLKPITFIEITLSFLTIQMLVTFMTSKRYDN